MGGHILDQITEDIDSSLTFVVEASDLISPSQDDATQPSLDESLKAWLHKKLMVDASFDLYVPCSRTPIACKLTALNLPNNIDSFGLTYLAMWVYTGVAARTEVTIMPHT